MINKFGKTAYLMVGSVLIFQLMGCGTLLYPERKGQRSGRIDVGIALLDGVGLFLFLIPGIIAYVVDFNNGTIYLPGGLSSSHNFKDLRQVKFDPKHSTFASIEKIIKKETGCSVKFSQSNLVITKLKSTNDMMLKFAQIEPEMEAIRIASNR